MTRTWRRLSRDRRGVAALELALVTPVMLILFFGTVEVTQLIRASNKLNAAAQAIGNMVAGQKTATSASVQNAYTGGQLMMAPFPTASFAVAVVSVTYNSSGTASTVGWQVLEGGASSMTTATACKLAANLGLGSDSVILVRASYNYNAVTSYILQRGFSLSHIAYGRPRNISVISGVSSTGALTGSC